MRITEREIDIGWRTLYGEARGEPYAGKVAVAWVIRNRVDDPGPDWWGDTYAQVCLKPRQFSCWDDQNRLSLLMVTLDDPAARACLRAFLEAVDGTEDPVQGAKHYHTHAVSPAWSAGKQPVVVIGNHRFYKLES